MKDRMTYNLARAVKLPSRGMATLIVLSVVYPSALTHAETAKSCALDSVAQGIGELQGSKSRALVVTRRIPTVSYRHALRGGMPRLKDTPYYEFEAPDGSYITVVDMSSAKARNHPKIKSLLEAWNKRTDEELRTLPQFEHLPAGSFNSLDYPDRTAVIAKTAKSVNDGSPEVQGGIRVVFARSVDEPLPLHDDFPEEPRAKGLAEPGRLSGSGNSTIFLHFAMRVIKDSMGTREIKVHTSKAHSVLYRRNGAKTNDIYMRDDKHWILRFGQMHVREVLKKTRKVLEVSVS